MDNFISKKNIEASGTVDYSVVVPRMVLTYTLCPSMERTLSVDTPEVSLFK